MKSFFTLLFAFGFFSLQAQTLSWVDQLGGTLEEQSNSVTTDASGNVYTTGRFQGTVDFDPGPATFNLTSAGSYDIFVSKVNADGSFAWAKHIGSDFPNGQERGHSIAVGTSGNIYVTGSFSDTTDFDPGEGVFNLITIPYHFSCPPHMDVFVLKLTPNGNFVWAKQVGGNGLDDGIALALDADENVHIVGSVASNMNEPVDYDPGPETYFLTSQAGAAAFILKLDSTGAFVWVDQWYSSNCLSASPCGYRDPYVYPTSVVVDGSGNVHCTGSFGCTVDFDPGEGIQSLSSVGGNNAFILKLNSSGSLQWVRQFSGNSGKGNDISVDASGNVYTTGWFTNTVDFDPGPLTKNLKSFANSSDIFVSKLNVSGNYIWAAQLGGTSHENGNSIDLDGNNNVYTTGDFSGTADFNPANAKYTLKSAGGYDVFVSKLNALGSFVWAVRLGGTLDDACSSIDVNGLDILHTTGVFRGTADFDPATGIYNLTAFGGADVFVHKMSPPASLWSSPISSRSFTDASFNLYPNPAQERVVISFVADEEINYQVILLDMNGRILKRNTGMANPGENKPEFILGNIPAGIYQVMLVLDSRCDKRLLFIK